MLLDALSPGARVGDLTVVAQLGRGGMGVVYEARDERAGRRVALKVPSRELLEGGSALARFEREAQAAAAVIHPNVVTLFSVGSLGGWPYLVLELLPRGSLRGLMKTRGALPWREACALARDVAQGLAAVHDAGLVHRDLKPENVLLDAQGRAKVTDFGLVRHQAGGVDLTNTGTFLGTAAYTSPEQIDSARKVGPSADLYALGCVLHELVAGAPPFPGTSYDVLAKHLQRAAPALRSSASGEVPPALDALVTRLLAKLPDDRPASAREVVDALSALLDGSPARGSRAALMIGAGAIALAASGALAWRLVATPEPVPVTTTEVAAVPSTAPLPLATTTTTTEPTPTTEPDSPAAEERSFALRPVAVADGAFKGTPGVNVTALVHDPQRGFLTGDADGGLFAWSETGAPEVSLPKACTDNPRLVASAGRVLTASVAYREATVTVWEWQRGTLSFVRSFAHDLVEDLASASSENGRRLWSVAISPDGALGLVAATTGQVAIFDLATGTRRQALTGAEHQPSVAWSQDGRWAFSGDRAGRLVAWELSRLPVVEPTRELEVHPVKTKNDNKGVIDVAVSADGATAVTIGTDLRVVVTTFDGSAPRTLGEHGLRNKNARTVSLSPDARFALTSDSVELKLWDLREQRLAARADTARVDAIVFVDERRFATSGVGGVRMWEIVSTD